MESPTEQFTAEANISGVGTVKVSLLNSLWLSKVILIQRKESMDLIDVTIIGGID